jgi:hypothetical protein
MYSVRKLYNLNTENMKATAIQPMFVAVPVQANEAFTVYRRFIWECDMAQLPIRGSTLWPFFREGFNRMIVMNKQRSRPRRVSFYNEHP